MPIRGGSASLPSRTGPSIKFRLATRGADADFDQAFTMADAVKHDEHPPDFFQSTITKDTEQGVTFEVQTRAAKPSEFEGRFGWTPNSLNIPVRDIRHPDTSAFKGIAVKDDGQWGGAGIAC
eukprot:1302057-Pyramimonas_sp.AAC.1